MSRYTCFVCGTGYDGFNCQTCALKKQAEEISRRAIREQREVTAATEAAIEEQTSRLAEEFERSREAAESAAFETQQAITQAAEDHRQALEEAADRHRERTANAWKLQSRAKSEQAYSLYTSGMMPEALDLARLAMEQDPSNIDAYFVAAAVLKVRGEEGKAQSFVQKQLQLLNIPEYRTVLHYYLQVLEMVGSNPNLMQVFRSCLKKNLPTWPKCEAVRSGMRLVDALLEEHQPDLAILVQHWILTDRGNELEALKSTRSLLRELSASSGGVAPWKAEIQIFVEQLEGQLSSSGSLSLIKLAYALEFSQMAGLDTGRARQYFSEVSLENRVKLDTDLLTLRKLVDSGDLDRETVTTIVRHASEKYLQWHPQIVLSSRAKAVQGALSITSGMGCLSTVFWFIALIAIGSLVIVLTGNGRAPMHFSFFVGVVLGTILLSVLTHRVLRYRKRYEQIQSSYQAEIAAYTNWFGQMNLPPLSAPKLKLVSPKIYIAGLLVLALGYVLAWQTVMLRSMKTAAVPANQAALYNGPGVNDDLSTTTSGTASGIDWRSDGGMRAAHFAAASSSRIEYPSLIPAQGTLELWIKIESGYEYSNYAFRPEEDHAIVFSTDAAGGDVTWPGATKLVLSSNGDVSLWMATRRYNRPPSVATVAHGTSFRFHEWHAVGISYGSQGQTIMVDGRIVANAPKKTQQLGGSGTSTAPVDLPTIGETVSNAWPHHRYNGGFEGMVARFRASAAQQDWKLAKGIVLPE